MKRLSLMALLLVFCIAASGIAETAAMRGKIELDLPNAPTAQDEINLDKTFFARFINMAHLPEYAAYAEMIEGVCIRVYDKAEDLGPVRSHHANRLKAEKWDTLIKIREMLHVSLLFAEEPGIVNGIFVAFTADDGSVGFANIYGTIDFEKLGILFGKLMESELVREFLKNTQIEIESKDGKTKD